MADASRPVDEPATRHDETLERALAVGDVVRLRKAHPCGSDAWIVVRLGADIGLRCTGCARKVMLPRSQLARQLRGGRAARPAGSV